MQPYPPESLPPQNLNFQRLMGLVGKANHALARYDGLLEGIPNAESMLSPLATREAVLSSKIEGTQATVEEVLEQEAGMVKEGDKYTDIQEILNYRHALYQADDHLEHYPVRLGFICELHKILMDSVRGQNKSPGEFRKEQTWIGPAGCVIEQATFVPPTPPVMRDALQALEVYMDMNDVDPLLQTAVVHAQFELIHPFKDGNGRIGRILIPLFLFQKKVLSQPKFYLSEYLESHREEYYGRLRTISEDGDWNGWIAFFLGAIIIQARANSQRAQAIMALYEKMKFQLRELTRSQYGVYLLDEIFRRPIFKSTDCATRLHDAHGMHTQTTANLLRRLGKGGVLQKLSPGSGRQAAVLCFPQLLRVAQGDES